MVLFGTDLFIGGDIDADDLCRALAELLPVATADIFADGDTAAYEVLGLRNIVRLYALPPSGTLAFKADLDFVERIPVQVMQSLADARELTVLLSRDTAFPEEAGTMAGEGYVIFRKGLPPRAGALVADEQDDEMAYRWKLLAEPLPPL